MMVHVYGWNTRDDNHNSFVLVRIAENLVHLRDRVKATKLTLLNAACCVDVASNIAHLVAFLPPVGEEA